MISGSAMYIHDNVVILSSMWYVLRFEHAHRLKRYNDRRMTRGQTTCSLGGTASLGLLLPYFILTNFYCRFPGENDCSFDGLLTLLRESGRHSKSSVKAVAIFLFLGIKSTLITVGTYYLWHVMKMCHVCYYNNSDATFRLLMSGDINPNVPWGPFLERPGNLPGPISVFGDKCFLTVVNFC